MTTIRLLTRIDGPAYQGLRLQSLQTNPEAFLSIFDGEKTLHEDIFSNHLDQSYHPPFLGYYGIFVDDELAGYVQLSQNFLEKQEHIAFLNNLYISPKFRNQGLATQLFDHILAELRDVRSGNERAKIERLFLSCTASNKSAYRLYQKLGFRRYGVKVKAIKWQGKYDDEVEMVKVL